MRASKSSPIHHSPNIEAITTRFFKSLKSRGNHSRNPNTRAFRPSRLALRASISSKSDACPIFRIGSRKTFKRALQLDETKLRCQKRCCTFSKHLNFPTSNIGTAAPRVSSWKIEFAVSPLFSPWKFCYHRLEMAVDSSSNFAEGIVQIQVVSLSIVIIP